MCPCPYISGSCPSRGTWIEMVALFLAAVALLGRAPRGARGLKCQKIAVAFGVLLVVPLAGHVD